MGVNRPFKSFLSAALAVCFLFFAAAGVQAEVKNVIVMISDGCGYNHIAAADYWTGEKAEYESFPVAIGMSTYSWSNQQEDPEGYDPDMAWAEFEYVIKRYTDSAAAATAMSTGVKTMTGAIGVDPDGQPLRNVVEAAEEKGMSTGVITSVQFSHATPAGFVAHVVSRHDYGKIADYMINESACEVVMGAGHPYHDDNSARVEDGEGNFRYVGSEEIWESLINGKAGADRDGDGNSDPWHFIERREDFVSLAEGSTPERVFGIPQVYSTLHYGRDGKVEKNDPQPPYTVPMSEKVPTLDEMTRGALNVLDNNANGFFLMIEGGAVDWAGHGNVIGRLIEEQIDFNRAVDSVIEWIERNSSWEESLLIVTADHECGGLFGPNSGVEGKTRLELLKPVVDKGKGNVPGFHFYSTHHTNNLVPFYAKGAGTDVLMLFADEEDPVIGKYLDNTEIAEAVFRLYK